MRTTHTPSTFRPAFFTIVLTCFLVLHAQADWTRFLGTDASATATDATAPLTWSDTQNLAYKTPLPGPGNSSPIILGNDLFITCYSGYGLDRREPGDLKNLKRHLLRINAQSGKVVWNKTVDASDPEDAYTGYLTEHGYASNTPATDGKLVFVNHGKSGVFAYDFSGKQIWHADIGKASSNKRWGSAASVILHKNLVIVNASEESNTLYAFDKQTGKEVWKSEAASLALAYGTPQIVTLPDGRDELLLAVPNEIWGMNPDSGKLRWFCESPYGGNISPSIVYGNGTAFAYGGFPKKGSVAVKVGGKRDVTASRLWTNDRTPYVSTPVFHQGHLYWVTRDGFAECQNATTGENVYKARLKSETGGPKFYASPVILNDHVIQVSRNAGTFVYKVGSTFDQTAQNLLADQSEFNATPAISNGRIYLRSNQALYAIGKNK